MRFMTIRTRLMYAFGKDFIDSLPLQAYTPGWRIAVRSVAHSLVNGVERSRPRLSKEVSTSMTPYPLRRLFTAFCVLFGVQTALHSQEKLPLEVVSVSPGNGTPTVRLHNTGTKAVTAYHFTAIATFSDTTTRAFGHTTDFVDMVSYASKLTPGSGPILAGEIRTVTLAPEKKGNATLSSLSITLDAVVFDDASYLGKSQPAVKFISDRRMAVLAQLKEWIVALETAWNETGGNIQLRNDQLVTTARVIAKRHDMGVPQFEEDLFWLFKDSAAGQPARTDRVRDYIESQKALRDTYERNTVRVQGTARVEQ